MKEETFRLSGNRKLTFGIYEMTLEGCTAEFTRPGQFVNITLDGLYLRRPISVCDYSGQNLTILYKVVGKGTEKMAGMHEGETLTMLTALGNGFDTSVSAQHVVLFGGGIGAAPLYKLAKDLIVQGKKVTVVLGFNATGDIYYLEEFRQTGAEVLVATLDGSVGTKGFVTDAVRAANLNYDYFYACGPMPMLKAICANLNTPGEVSLEARMGCGFGICMGCSVETKQGTRRICKEGPVFRKEDLLW